MTYRADPHHVAFAFEGVTTESSTCLFDGANDFTLERLNGFLTSEKAPLISDGVSTVSTRLAFREGKSAIGEWLGIYSNEKGQYLAIGDPFGYQPVYYRFLPTARKLLIGTSPQALADAALNSGEDNAPNWAQLLASVGTTHAWSITMQSNQSFEANTKVLLPGQHIEISNTFWYVSASSFFEPQDEYESLLERGIRRAVQQIRTASSLNVDQKRINLSGGKDSRMVLALLDAAKVTDEFTVTTMNPQTWLPKSARPALYRDLYVANYLRSQYRLDWTEPFQQEFVPLSFEASINEWQQYRQHRNFKLRPSNHLYIQNGLNIELRGAAGETFRGFNAVAGLVTKLSFQNSPKSFKSDVQLLINHLYGGGLLLEEQLEEVSEQTYALFLELGAETIEDALHRRYTVFRNGSHFGHTRHSMSHGQIPVLPLSQPEFVQASQLLSTKQRDAGQVAFDIIERTTPALNEITFDGGYWSESLLPPLRRADNSSIETESPYLEQFFDLDKTAIEARLESRRQAVRRKNIPRAFDARFETLNRIKQTLHALNSSFASDPLFNGAFQRRLLQGIEAKKIAPNPLLAKLDSMLLAISGGANSTQVVVRPALSPTPPLFMGRTTEQSNNLSETERQPRFQLPLKLDADTVEASIRLFGTISQPMEFKFSLFTDGRKTVQTEYSASQTVSFSRPSSGKSRVQAFARYPSDPDIIFKFYSRYF